MTKTRCVIGQNPGLIYVLQESVTFGFHFNGTICDPNEEIALLDFDTWDVSVLVLCA